MKPYEEYVKDFNNVLVNLFKLTPDVDDVDDLESEIRGEKVCKNLQRIIKDNY